MPASYGACTFSRSIPDLITIVIKSCMQKSKELLCQCKAIATSYSECTHSNSTVQYSSYASLLNTALIYMHLHDYRSGLSGCLNRIRTTLLTWVTLDEGEKCSSLLNLDQIVVFTNFVYSKCMAIASYTRWLTKLKTWHTNISLYSYKIYEIMISDKK